MDVYSNVLWLNHSPEMNEKIKALNEVRFIFSLKDTWKITVYCPYNNTLLDKDRVQVYTCQFVFRTINTKQKKYIKSIRSSRHIRSPMLRSCRCINVLK